MRRLLMLLAVRQRLHVFKLRQAGCMVLHCSLLRVKQQLVRLTSWQCTLLCVKQQLVRLRGGLWQQVWAVLHSSTQAEQEQQPQ